MKQIKYSLAESLIIDRDMMLDEVDKRILEVLEKDSRTPLRKISKQVKIPPSTVYGRIKRLRKRGVVRRFVAILNPKALGFLVLAFVLIKARAGMCSTVTEGLKEYPEILEIYEVTGDYDIIIKVIMRSYEELNTFLDKIGGIEGIESTCTMVVFKTHKDIAGFFPYLSSPLRKFKIQK